LWTAPVGEPDTISIRFSENVNVVASDLTLVGLRTFNLPTVVEFTYNAAAMMATWRFDDLVANDQYAIILSDAVTDVEGNRLDGEWVNAASVTTANPAESHFPSGDGNAGGHFSFVVTLLAGDATGTNVVDANDYATWESYYGQQVSEFYEGDFNGDGWVDEADLLLLYANEGIDLQTLEIAGDLNGDYAVDDSDMNLLAENMGMTNATREDGDLNGDGTVSMADLDLALAQFGLELWVVS